MKVIVHQPRSWRRYTVTDQELKDALGINWPGAVLAIRRDYDQKPTGWEITMYQQPDEVDPRYLNPEADVPDDTPPEPEAPAPRKRRRWWG